MLKLYNTLTRTVEKFLPIDTANRQVTMYSCGPTVYDYQHIGHMRRYVGDDILVRILTYNRYAVHHVMNITDVGHLVSDADEGEDKMEKGARKFRKSVWDIAHMFEEQFKESCKALHIALPIDLLHATDYIPQQIAFIKQLEKNEYTYTTADGIYFDTSKFPDYTQLSRQKEDELKAGARVEMSEGKKHATDFALWKFDPRAREGKTPIREMDWWFQGEFAGQLFSTKTMQQVDSASHVWKTIGFPGWHIECSTMSLEGLYHIFQDGKLREERVQTIDIHTGGIDHIAIHHTNEIAQAEAATGKKFVHYWVHHNFLQVNGEKMSKSLNNFFTVQEVVAQGYDPLALRYLYLQTHYRQEMNFTWDALNGAQTAYAKLVRDVSGFTARTEGERVFIGCAEFEQRFFDAVNDDMNMAKALAIVWELVKSEYPPRAKIASLKKFDEVLGLELFEKKVRREKIPQSILDLVHMREKLRTNGDFSSADALRTEILELGYEITDTKQGPQLTLVQKKQTK